MSVEKFKECQRLGLDYAIKCTKCQEWFKLYANTKRADVAAKNLENIKQKLQQKCVICGGKLILVAAEGRFNGYQDSVKIYPY